MGKTDKIPYVHYTEVHNTRAASIVLPIVFNFIKPSSVLDVGCGLGTWLKVCRDLGVKETTGLDGSYVDRSLLAINENCFIPYDLKKPFNLGKKFDLAICLEVAEHLPESSADYLVQSLIKHADTILFSAAIKGQDGYNHINLQWYGYWQEKFKKHGFEFYDVIRGKIWWNREVDRWYRQNIFLVSNKRIEQRDQDIICAFHPEIFDGVVQKLNQLKEGKAGIRFYFNGLLTAIKNKLLGNSNSITDI